MAKTRRKEITFYIENGQEQSKFLELIRKKVSMVDLHIMVRQNKIRIVISGSHEAVRYAIQLIKRIRSSL
ncbi:MAG: DUF2067 family protein [Candidatus Helarchaeota archaeon]